MDSGNDFQTTVYFYIMCQGGNRVGSERPLIWPLVDANAKPKVTHVCIFTLVHLKRTTQTFAKISDVVREFQVGGA